MFIISLYINLKVYSVITVHGIRDDYKTSWTDHKGAWWVKDQLFSNLSIREVDYSYEIDEGSVIYAPDGINRLATSLIDEYAQLRSKLMEVTILLIVYSIETTSNTSRSLQP